ncbi:hypothetical protein [Pseudoxanthomonas mexicana]|uniref:hypothetical protein n=1 Tax=Pseudoxanthomonas mexicana TaxID=128785 RepID=UPI0028ADE41D|nr:hypothetical protein [Pseudoxanthomonas mexicana]
MDGWLKPAQDWLLQQLQAIWEAIEEVANDVALFFLKHWLAMVLAQWDLIPMPDFLQGYSLCALLQQTGPTVQWALTTFQIPLGLSFIAGGYTFRMIRKIVTLFQW